MEILAFSTYITANKTNNDNITPETLSVPFSYPCRCRDNGRKLYSILISA